MNHPESYPIPEDESAEPEFFASSLELKEIISMFAERREEISTVLNVIEHELMTPIPDPSDLHAVEEYNSKMEMLQELASEYLKRSDELEQMWGKIEKKKINGQ